ncbi:hypothetical protein MMC07_004486 [Pseudocyphellaria aurata]|nr:hypothetical protein [Pseudocyphellaria aurata]
MRDKASRKGVTIDIDDFGMQAALNPETHNRIEVGNLRFSVYVRGNPLLIHIEHSIERLPELGALDLQYLANRAKVSETEYSLGEDAPKHTEYHILKNECHPFDKPNLRKLIHKRTGAAAVGKIYSRKEESSARFRYSNLSNILGPAANEHINPILGVSSAGPGFMIVTEHWRATTLETLLEIGRRPEAWEIEFMFAQLATALRFLKEHKIIHRDIRPGTILIANSGSMSSRLAGFSESYVGLTARDVKGDENFRAPEMNGTYYDAKVDVYSLCKTVKTCFLNLSISDPVANLADIGLTKRLSERPSAAKLCESIDLFANGHYDSPFRYITASRRFVFHSTCKAREIFVNTSELLEAICACTRFVPSTKWLTPGTSKFINGLDLNGNYCDFDEASRILRICKQPFVLIIPPEIKCSMPTHTSFEIYTTYNFRISYHAPSSMMNFSKLQRFIGTIGLGAIPEDFVPTNTQEVHGFEELEGTYIDFCSFQLVQDHLRSCKDLNLEVRMEDVDPFDAPVLRDRFTGVDSSKYIILPTERMIPDLVLLNRDDCSVSELQVKDVEKSCDQPLQPPYLMPEEAACALESCGLNFLGCAIRRLSEQPRTLNWKKFIRWTASESDCDRESAASPTVFTFKRKRVPSNEEETD